MELAEAIQGALDAADGDIDAAAPILLEDLHRAAADGDGAAAGTLSAFTRSGARKAIMDYRRTHDGRLTMAVIRNTVPASKSVHRRSDDGAVVQLRLLYLDMEFREIREKIQEMSNQRGHLDDSIMVAARMYALAAQVPSAGTPRAALDVLGVSVDEWLNGEVAASSRG